MNLFEIIKPKKGSKLKGSNEIQLNKLCEMELSFTITKGIEYAYT